MKMKSGLRRRGNNRWSTAGAHEEETGHTPPLTHATFPDTQWRKKKVWSGISWSGERERWR